LQLHEETLAVFWQCIGHTFVIDHFNDIGWAALVVGSVTGRPTETIWVDPRHLEKITVG
jgi:hypothetical protein